MRVPVLSDGAASPPSEMRGMPYPLSFTVRLLQVGVRKAVRPQVARACALAMSGAGVSRRIAATGCLLGCPATGTPAGP